MPTFRKAAGGRACAVLASLHPAPTRPTRTWLKHQGGAERVVGAVRRQLVKGLVQHALFHLRPTARGGGQGL
jgi:hypothetical protein